MATDPTLLARQAIIAHLRSDTAVAATEVGQRIYERPPPQPTWPFALYSADFGQLRGRVALHVFSKTQFTDEVAGIMSAFVTSLGGKRIDMDDGRKLDLIYPDAGGSQILRDAAEADAHHGIVHLDALIARECAPS